MTYHQIESTAAALELVARLRNYDQCHDEKSAIVACAWGFRQSLFFVLRTLAAVKTARDTQ